LRRRKQRRTRRRRADHEALGGSGEGLAAVGDNPDVATPNPDRLTANLREQLDFLEASCARFDEGYEHEAKRIALSIRVLVHDTKRSQSLLGLLGMKGALRFVDTAQSLQMTSTFELALGLVVAVMEPKQERYEPYLDAYGSDRRVPFDDWWGTVLVRPVDFRRREKQGERAVFTRKDFILGAANQEGGGHVDPNPTRWWRDLRDQDYLGAMEVRPGVPVAQLVPATIRQIGWEVLETLGRER
jgi:hypothetical protein